MTYQGQPIRIAIADEQHVMREGICKTIAAFGGFAIDIEAGDGGELIRKLQKAKKKPDICMFDISMPHKNGYETLKEIKAQWPAMKVLIFTIVDKETAVIEMFKNEANGYLLKTCDSNELKKALLAIYKTGSYHSEFTSNILHHSLNKKKGDEIKDAEIRFLSFICCDCEYSGIAEKMYVSPRTVEAYRDALFSKLHVKTRTGLVMYAVSIGLAPRKAD